MQNDKTKREKINRPCNKREREKEVLEFFVLVFTLRNNSATPFDDREKLREILGFCFLR